MVWYNPLTWFKRKSTVLKHTKDGGVLLSTKEQNFTLTVKDGNCSLNVVNDEITTSSEPGVTTAAPANKF